MSENVETSGAPQRPAFLTVLCILSFIASGIGIIGLLFFSAMKGAAETVGGDIMNDAMERAQSENPELFNNSEMNDATNVLETATSWPYIIISVLLILVSLYGVIKMWNLKKQGFFIYTGAAIAGIIVPLLFGIGFTAWSLVIPLIFIGLYYMNTKVMS